MEQNHKQHMEDLVHNKQKGEIYRMKLKSSSLVFVAIPMLNTGPGQDNEDLFSYKILEPEEYKGNYKGRVEDIEFMAKLPY